MYVHLGFVYTNCFPKSYQALYYNATVRKRYENAEYHLQAVLYFSVSLLYRFHRFSHVLDLQVTTYYSIDVLISISRAVTFRLRGIVGVCLGFPLSC